MTYKNYNNVKNKTRSRKAVFYILIFIYIFGLVTGCMFTLKNTENLEFVKKITLTESLFTDKSDNYIIHSSKFIIRDVILLLFVLIFKYSGILKGLSSCIPAILSIQNSSVYAALMIDKKISVFNLMFNYIIKDTAISFLILSYCFIIFNEIIEAKENPERDIKRFSIYLSGIIVVYLLNFLIKLVVIPLHPSFSFLQVV